MLGITVDGYDEDEALGDDEFHGLPAHVAGDPGDGGRGGWKQYWERNQAKMNVRQDTAFNTILNALKLLLANQRGIRLFFLEGAGGTGTQQSDRPIQLLTF